MTDSRVPLPTEWQLAWTVRSSADRPLRFLPTPAIAGEAGVCDVRPATSAASTLSHADTLVHCAVTNDRTSARSVIWIAAGATATIRLVTGNRSAFDASVAAWPQLTVNGGCPDAFPPILARSSIQRFDGRNLVRVTGMFESRVVSASLVLAESEERVDLDVLEQAPEQLLLEASERTSLAGRLEVRDSIGAMTAIDVLEEGVVATPWASRRLIVRFQPGEIEPPAGRAGGQPNEFTARSTALIPSLSEAGIVRLEKLLPWFDHEDVYSYNLIGEPVTLIDMADFYVAHLDEATEETSARDLLSRVPEVRHAERDVAVGAYLTPNDPYYAAGLQWGLENSGQNMCSVLGAPNVDINATTAWNRSTGSPAVQVAILDTGIDSEHFDLRTPPPANLQRAVLDTSFVPGESAFDLSTNGHGTAVTGIAAATGNDGRGVAGVAWNVTPVSVKVFNQFNSGWVIWLVQGIDHARVKGYPIINVSGGYPSGPGFGPLSPDSVSALAAVCYNAYVMGQFVVAASGNTATDGSDDYNDLRFDAYPAALSRRVYAVGAVLNTGVRWRDKNIATNFCAQNPAICRSSNYGPWLDALAPGGRFIVTASNISIAPPDSFHHLRNCNAANLTGTGFTGTSAAAPFVSGTAALLRSYGLGFTPPVVLTGDDIEQILNLTASHPYPFAIPSLHHGYGFIRANLALDFIAPPKVVIQDHLSDEKPLAYLRAQPDSMYINSRTFLNVPSLPANYLTSCWRVRLHGSARHGGYSSVPALWVRPSACIGWRDTALFDFNSEVPWARATTIGTDSSSFETYVYRIPLPGPGGGEQYFPAAPPQARVAYTAVGFSRPVGVGDPGWAEGLELRTSPNPAQGGMWIELALPHPGMVRVNIHDISGRIVGNLERRVDAPGLTRLWWNAAARGARCPAGVYWCRIEFGGARVARRFVLIGG